MNHFFAIPVPAAVQEYISDNIVHWWRGAMGEDFAPQWCAPEDYHITLKFLGDVPVTEQSRLIAAAHPIAAQTEPFPLRLAEPGTFPKNRSSSARVFWMGVAQDEALSRLTAQIEDFMAAAGFAREDRPYTPHITLARRRRYASGRSSPGVVLAERAFPTWQADTFALMQTTPLAGHRNRDKARYNTVHLFPFGTTPSSAE